MVELPRSMACLRITQVKVEFLNEDEKFPILSTWGSTCIIITFPCGRICQNLEALDNVNKNASKKK